MLEDITYILKYLDLPVVIEGGVIRVTRHSFYVAAISGHFDAWDDDTSLIIAIGRAILNNSQWRRVRP